MGFDLRIATALSGRGIRGRSGSNSSNNLGGLRVHAGVHERHLLQDEREGIKGGIDKALLRAKVRGIRR
jgi:hypothetical protein